MPDAGVEPALTGHNNLSNANTLTIVLQTTS